MLHPLRRPLLSPGEPPVSTGAVLALPRRTLELDTRVAIMGIVNNTPDSFYDRGATFGVERAVAHALRLVEEGADIIDVGGVKGGPGPEVTPEEERERVVPVITELRVAHPELLISVDTTRAVVAAAALDAGADLVNDSSGGADDAILDVVAARGAGYVVMHHGGRPRTRPFRRAYLPDVTTAVVAHCRALAAAAEARGVRRDRIVVDPGHDFQKTTYHSLELCRRLPELAALGYPVLVALSRKDFIGETLGLPLEQRLEGSLAAAVFCVLRGAHILRVHDVAATRRAVAMVEAMAGWRLPAVTVRGLE